MSHAFLSSNLAGRCRPFRDFPTSSSRRPANNVDSKRVSQNERIQDINTTKSAAVSWIERTSARINDWLDDLLEESEETIEPEPVIRSFILQTPQGPVTVECIEKERVADLLARAARVASECGIVAPANVGFDAPAGSRGIDTDDSIWSLPPEVQLIICGLDKHTNMLFVNDQYLGPAIVVVPLCSKEFDFREDSNVDVFSELLVCRLDF